jgi:hypothetical protein
MTIRRFRLPAAALLAAGCVLATGAAEPLRVIELTQTACQFLEPEPVDHGFRSTGKADCEAINAGNAQARTTASRTLELTPGRYVFRVTNRDVPYALGFWLRGDGVVARATLPSVSGGGLTQGASRDYTIELEPGEYVYSCPLNPTPNYRLVVKG